MNQLLERLRENFHDEDARYAYVEAFMNASVAAQIKGIRETEQMSQQDLADKIGTKQSGISRLEKANYHSWKVETLSKIARAFGLRLRISFEEFGTLVPEIENFKQANIQKRPFSKDPVFQASVASAKPPKSETKLSAMPEVRERGRSAIQEPDDPFKENRQTPDIATMPPKPRGFGGLPDSLGRAEAI